MRWFSLKQIPEYPHAKRISYDKLVVGFLWRVSIHNTLNEFLAVQDSALALWTPPLHLRQYRAIKGLESVRGDNVNQTDNPYASRSGSREEVPVLYIRIAQDWILIQQRHERGCCDDARSWDEPFSLTSKPIFSSEKFGQYPQCFLHPQAPNSYSTDSPVRTFFIKAGADSVALSL